MAIDSRTVQNSFEQTPDSTEAKQSELLSMFGVREENIANSTRQPTGYEADTKGNNFVAINDVAFDANPASKRNGRAAELVARGGGTDHFADNGSAASKEDKEGRRRRTEVTQFLVTAGMGLAAGGVLSMSVFRDKMDSLKSLQEKQQVTQAAAEEAIDALKYEMELAELGLYNAHIVAHRMQEAQRIVAADRITRLKIDNQNADLLASLTSKDGNDITIQTPGQEEFTLTADEGVEIQNYLMQAPEERDFSILSPTAQKFMSTLEAENGTLPQLSNICQSTEVDKELNKLVPLNEQALNADGTLNLTPPASETEMMNENPLFFQEADSNVVPLFGKDPRSSSIEGDIGRDTTLAATMGADEQNGRLTEGAFTGAVEGPVMKPGDPALQHEQQLENTANTGHDPYDPLRNGPGMGLTASGMMGG